MERSTHEGAYTTRRHFFLKDAVSMVDRLTQKEKRGKRGRPGDPNGKTYFIPGIQTAAAAAAAVVVVVVVVVSCSTRPLSYFRS